MGSIIISSLGGRLIQPKIKEKEIKIINVNISFFIGFDFFELIQKDFGCFSSKVLKKALQAFPQNCLYFERNSRGKNVCFTIRIIE